MEILNKVGRLSAQEMLEKIEKAALINYGLHRYPVKEYFSGNPGKRIVASLDNADTDHVLLEILREILTKFLRELKLRQNYPEPAIRYFIFRTKRQN